MDEKKKVSSGFQNVYAEIPFNKEPASQISLKKVQKRAKYGMELLSNIASDNNDDAKTLLVITEMIKVNKAIFIKAAEKAGIPMVTQLTQEQAINIQSLMCLPMNKVRSLR